MAGARIWPNGVISGWCLVGNDHHRCAGPHVADPAVSGCHCAVCLDREANPPAVVDDAPNPAEAPPAPEPGASAGTNDARRPVVINGDATALPLRAASVDAIVCDPPYGLEFMGKEWDRPWAVGTSTPGYGDAERLARPAFGDSRNANCRTCGGRQRGARRCSCASPKWDRDPAEDMRAFGAWSGEWAAEAFRVLKPGGYLLAFGGSRTWHRLACAVEDAGFELRDSIAWLYGSGFPKSLDVSKALDKLAGAEREVVGSKIGLPGYSLAPDAGRGVYNASGRDSEVECAVTAPATDAARQWQGWGTALKPAFEPIIVARKPLVGTVAANVQQHGTGALNIDGCRVGSDVDTRRSKGNSPNAPTAFPHSDDAWVPHLTHAGSATGGRWPTNVVLSHGDCADGCEPGCPVASLDQQSGTLKSGANPTRRGSDKFRDAYGEFRGQAECTPARGVDVGGASRFFPAFRYQAKAPTRERPVGPDGIKHPTVKPLDLMRWMVRLVCPPGGTVLDMFAGSGTTGEACTLEGFACVLVEQHAPYLPLIVQRADRSTPTPAEPTAAQLDLLDEDDAA